MAGRKFFVGGNWKMNGSKASIDGIIQFMNEKGVNPKTGCKTELHPFLSSIFDYMIDCSGTGHTKYVDLY